MSKPYLNMGMTNKETIRVFVDGSMREHFAKSLQFYTKEILDESIGILYSYGTPIGIRVKNKKTGIICYYGIDAKFSQTTTHHQNLYRSIIEPMILSRDGFKHICDVYNIDYTNSRL